MPADVLLHLLEPAAWRLALAEGAVRPPSLAEVGFVHLSRPDQVHLPAQALFPGRRDLVLLVVDPARLTDPVREEPGRPEDPEGMRFPHLYGPLPTNAVVAVVPYRPPATPVLPDPGDRRARALAVQVSVPVRRAVEVRDVPGGVAVADPRFPHSRDDNRLLLTAPVDAPTVEAGAAEAARDLGWPHRAAALLWPDAGPVARELAGRGWAVEDSVLMARPAGPGGHGDRAEVVEQREVHPLWERSWRQLLAPQLRDPLELDEVVGQLVGREHRNDAVLAVTDVAVRDAGRVVAAGQLRIDGATAVVDSVLTDRDARGRGFAGAVLARILALAAASGGDLVVLEALARDWPREWYGRCGFEVVGSVWNATAPRLSGTDR